MACEIGVVNFAPRKRITIRPGGRMKFGIVVGAVSGLALCARAATAQVCQGDLSFRNSSKHVGAALAMSDHATSFGGGASAGHCQGIYAGGSDGISSYSNLDGN